MAKEKFDLAFGLGPACSCTMSLRRAGLQHLSFPYDWIGPKENTPEFDIDVRTRAEQIAAEFHGWLNPADFMKFDPPDGALAPRDCYFNEGLRLLFIHDFPKGSDFETEFPKIKEKYRRRIGRLLELIRSSKRVLLLRVDRPDLRARTSVEDCKAAVRILSEKFAPAKFELLLLHCEADRPFENLLETDHGDGVRSIVFDYRGVIPDLPSFQPNFSLIERLLTSRFSVRDYRTSAERAEKKRRERQAKYRQYGVSNWWQLRLARWRKRLARHFVKNPRAAAR